MHGIQIWDEHYFAFTAVLTIGIQLACFFVAYRMITLILLRTLLVSMNKVLLAVITLCLKGTESFFPFFVDMFIILTVLLVVS